MRHHVEAHERGKQQAHDGIGRDVSREQRIESFRNSLGREDELPAGLARFALRDARRLRQGVAGFVFTAGEHSQPGDEPDRTVAG